MEGDNYGDSDGDCVVQCSVALLNDIADIIGIIGRCIYCLGFSCIAIFCSPQEFQWTPVLCGKCVPLMFFILHKKRVSPFTQLIITSGHSLCLPAAS